MSEPTLRLGKLYSVGIDEALRATLTNVKVYRLKAFPAHCKKQLRIIINII